MAALSPSKDEMRTDAEFVEVRKIWGLLESFWEMRLRKPVEPSILVIFSGETRSECGILMGATGPHYCPEEGKTYLDLNWWKALEGKFGAPGIGARVYALAHEYAHHIQHKVWNVLIPVYELIALQDQDLVKASHIAVSNELWADALAGHFFGHLYLTGRMNREEVTQGLSAAAQMGDEVIYRTVMGHGIPKGYKFSHGTAYQRREWMRKGLYARKATDLNPFLNKDWNADHDRSFIREIQIPFQDHLANPPF